MGTTLDITHTNETKDVELFALSGGLDSATYHELEKIVNTRIEAGARKIVLDLGSIDYLGSAGLRAFHGINKQLTEAEPVGQLKLANISDPASRVMKTLGFDQFLSISADVKTAIDSF